MAGKRQHFVPQFLQRGFASHVVGEEAYTWVYRRGVQPFNTNVKNAGVEGFFYSLGQDMELDESITDFEGEFNFLVSDLRLGRLNLTDNAFPIARLLAHLEVRTRHLRQSFLKMGTQILDRTMKFASNEEALGDYFRRAIHKDPSILQDAMAKEMRKYGIPMQYLPQIIEMAWPLLEKILPKTVSQVSGIAQQFRNSLPGALNETTKAGHVKGLQRTLAPESKVSRFSNLRFQVIECTGSSLVLGDSILLFQVAGDRDFKPFYEGKDILLAVYLPLGPEQVLVGSRAALELDASLLRREIARSSLEYFISNEAPPEHSDIQLLVGDNAYLRSDDEIEKMVHELMND
jgi:hypothetical protein